MRDAQVAPTHTPALLDAAVRRATELLRAGDLVALPTETVYGLAANALDARAVSRIFAAKGRPSHNPVIVHISSIDMARQCVRDWPKAADRLARVFWPGPLTLVLRRAPCIPDIITAGGDTVGVRWPSHPVIEAVIESCGFPLAAPSANVSNRLSATTAEHVRRGLGHRVQLILDGGPCAIGIESTVLDLTAKPPRILRPGLIGESALAAALGKRVISMSMPNNHGRLRSPGRLPRHYTSKARVYIWNWRNEAALRLKIAEHGLTTKGCHVLARSRVPSSRGFGGVTVLPREAPDYARALYAALHCCDEAGAQTIIVETPPAAPEWRGIADRLKRASA